MTTFEFTERFHPSRKLICVPAITGTEWVGSRGPLRPKNARDVTGKPHVLAFNARGLNFFPGTSVGALRRRRALQSSHGGSQGAGCRSARDSGPASMRVWSDHKRPAEQREREREATYARVKSGFERSSGRPLGPQCSQDHTHSFRVWWRDGMMKAIASMASGVSRDIRDGPCG